MLPTNYRDLLDYFMPRPVRDEENYKATQTVLDALLDCENPTKDQEDYRYLLGIIIEDYESLLEPLPDAPPHEMIRFLLEAQSKSVDDLLPLFNGNTQRWGNVVNGTRPPSNAEIIELALFFNVSPQVFFAVESK